MCQKGQLRISVVDTGIGMEEDEITKLFKPFNQANSEIS
jgi:signal transduction histidine kinase